METYDQGTVLLKREVQILRELLHHLVSTHIQLRHQGSRRRIIAGMDDRTVGLRCTTAHIFFFFDDTGIYFIS